MTVDKSIFGKNLTALKEGSGKTWPEIAADLGYQGPKKERHLLALAAGRYEPRLATVRKFASYFGVRWQSMLEDGKAVARDEKGNDRHA